MNYILLLLLLLAYLSNSQTVIAKSDSSNTIDNTKDSATLQPSSFPEEHLPNIVGIWNKQGNASPAGTVVTFTKLLYLSCGGPLQISIAAHGNYKIYWDDSYLFNGDSTEIVAQNLPSKCGQHNLTIVVTKIEDADAPSGLIYSVSQDQSNCYNCNSNGIWNQHICACECLQVNLCGCPNIPGTNRKKTWADYPTCACICPVKTSVGTPLGAI